MGIVMSVFLGGSCNPTVWRSNIAMPILQRAGITFYNPQVKDWYPELLAQEQEAKTKASVLLFVIDCDTRALMSMLEAVELAVAGRKVVLAVSSMEQGQHIGDDIVGAAELKDLNRARSFVRDIAQRYAVPVYNTVEDAVQAAVHLVRQEQCGSFEGDARVQKLRRTASMPVRSAPGLHVAMPERVASA